MCRKQSVVCVRGQLQPACVEKTGDSWEHTVHTQPPFDGAVMEVADESGVPTMRPLSLLWPFLPLGSFVLFLDCFHV